MWTCWSVICYDFICSSFFKILTILEEHEEILRKEKEAHAKVVEQAKLSACEESGFVLFKNVFA